MEETELRARLAVLEEAVAWIGAHLPSPHEIQSLRRHLGDTPDGHLEAKKAADALLRRMDALHQRRS